jgi:hypothetical protein
MFLLQNLFEDEDVIETPEFYWNLWGTDEDMPNFWLKETNIQLEWYSDNPGRGAWSNYESSAPLALLVLKQVQESYATHTRGKEATS